MRCTLRADEACDEVGGRSFEKVAGRSFLDDLSFPEEDDAVSEVDGFGEVVRDQDDGLCELLEDVAEVLLEFCSDHGVERAHGFVEQEDLGVEHEGAHEPDALPLSA